VLSTHDLASVVKDLLGACPCQFSSPGEDCHRVVLHRRSNFRHCYPCTRRHRVNLRRTQRRDAMVADPMIHVAASSHTSIQHLPPELLRARLDNKHAALHDKERARLKVSIRQLKGELMKKSGSRGFYLDLKRISEGNDDRARKAVFILEQTDLLLGFKMTNEMSPESLLFCLLVNGLVSLCRGNESNILKILTERRTAFCPLNVTCHFCLKLSKLISPPRRPIRLF